MSTRIMRMLPRDPVTGRLLRSDRLPERKPEKPVLVDPTFHPIRVWTAGPGSDQKAIVIPGSSQKVRPRTDGSYLIESAVVEAQLKNSLPGRWWIDDVPEGDPSARCEACGWTCRSYRAMNHHQNNSHARPQTTY